MESFLYFILPVIFCVVPIIESQWKICTNITCIFLIQLWTFIIFHNPSPSKIKLKLPKNLCINLYNIPKVHDFLHTLV